MLLAGFRRAAGGLVGVFLAAVVVMRALAVAARILHRGRRLAGARLLALARGLFLLRLLNLGVATCFGLLRLRGGFHLGLVHVEILKFKFGNLALHQLLDVAQRVGGFGADERHGETRGSRAARAPDAVHVVFGHGGQVVVHHVLHLFHVDAARQHVGGNQYVGLAVGEVLECAATLVLAAAGVDGLHVVAHLLQAAARGVSAAARAAEHDDTTMPAFFQQPLQQRGLHRLLYVHDVLLDGVGRLSLMRDLHHGGVAQQLAGRFHDGVVDGGREQKRLAA